jgi:putative spermidine/putrescine transport system substrate-binding protein
MWRGDPSVNRYVDGWVAPRLRERYGVTLNPVPGQGAELLNQLVVERGAGRDPGTADLLWINGETFANLREEGLLHGPWAGRLPGAAYVDSASRIITRDFEQDPAGYESPWGTVQFALIYDTARTPDPPRSYAALARWVRAHPGRFTHDQQFTGVTFLKGLMYSLGGGAERFRGGFDPARYAEASARVFAWLDSARGSFWRGGATYPADVAEVHRLFANREIDFSMSNNQNDVVTKVRQGVLPPTARAFVLEDGTIANAHFLGIPANAPNVAGAMVVANFLLSPEAQLEKQKPEVWADGTVLDRARLPPEWAARFAALARDPRAIPPDTLAKYARPEVAPTYTERLVADWRERVRQGRR